MMPEMGEIVEDRTLTFGTGDEEISVLLLKQEIGRGLIGMIQSRLFEGNVALVVLHDKPEDDDFDMAYHGHSLDGQAERVGMEEALIDGLRKETDEALFVLFHELGHLVNHDAIATGDAFDAYMQERKDFVGSGKVLEIELRADDFAARYFGSKRVINGLTALMEREKAYYSPEVYDPDEIETTLAEMRLRIHHQENKREA